MNFYERAMARSPAEVEARMRALPRWLRRTTVAVVVIVAIPWGFFDRLAREWWLGLRMAVLDVRGNVDEARRIWRG